MPNISLDFILAILIYDVTIGSAFLQESCGIFRDVDKTYWYDRVYCDSSCINGYVIGTESYHPNSSICLSAQHAGIYFPSHERQTIRFKKLTKSRSFVGSINNRIISYSWDNSHGDSFEFTYPVQIRTENYTEDTWMTDVYLLHNSYKGGILMSACVFESPIYSRNRILTYLKDLNMFQIEGDHTIIGIYRGKSMRTLTCQGQTTLTDATGVFSRRDDKCNTGSQNTFAVTRNHDIKIPIKCSPNFYGKYIRRFLDVSRYLQGNADATIPSFKISNAKLEDVGIYLVLTDRRYNHRISTRYFEDIGTYFKLYVADCPPGRYGEYCNSYCKRCENGGRCHPATGSCICKPGFSGSFCEKTCPYDYFGSKCQLTCSTNSGKTRFVDQSQPDCKGITICLPDPIGCTCARGYKGPFCEEKILLQLPVLELPPIVMINDNSIQLYFLEWDPAKDRGFTYGHREIYYVVHFKNRTHLNHISKIKSKEWIYFFYGLDEIEDEQLYRVGVEVRLRDLNRSELAGWINESSKLSPWKAFTLPCLKIGNSNFTFEQRGKILHLEVPIPKQKFGFKLNCNFYLHVSDGHGQKYLNFSRTVSEDEDKFTHQVNTSDYPDGTHLSAESFCQNQFGRCKSLFADMYTPANLNKYINRSGDSLILQNFDILKLAETKIWLIGVKTDKITLWKKFKEQLTSHKNGISSTLLKFSAGIQKIIPTERFLQIRTGLQVLNLSLPREEGLLGMVLEYKNGNNCTGCFVYSVLEFATQGPTNSSKYIVISTVSLIISLLVIFIVFLTKRCLSKGAFKRISGISTAERRNIGALPILFSKQKSPTDISVSGNDSEYMSVEGVSFSPDSGSASRDQIHLLDFELQKILNRMINSKELFDKFQSIPTDYGLPTKIATQPQNKKKNRYRNNLPYDSTRVVLSSVESNSDYVNANHVQGFGDKRRYIASQGPKDANVSTIADFWRMIIEQKVDVILMVVNFYENGVAKVGCYFNRQTPLQVDSYVIICLENVQHHYYIQTTIEISHALGSHRVYHYQFTKWPDHGIPQEHIPLSTMLRHVLNNHPEGTMVVHCSAGIGRTGTVLLILLMDELLKLTKQVDPIQIVERMRRFRARLVENYNQFNFALKVFEELLFSHFGLIEHNELLENFEKIVKQNGNHLERLNLLGFNKTFERDLSLRSKRVNRDRSILPTDMHRIILGAEESELAMYTYAISIQLQDILDFIITLEYPTEVTLQNFWYMIFEKKCSTVTFLNGNENEQLGLSEGLMVPQHESPLMLLSMAFTSGPIIADDAFMSFQEVQIRIGELTHSVKVRHVHNWPEYCPCPSDLKVLNELSSLVLGQGIHSGPNVFCCKDGITACGLAIGAIMVIDHMQQYQELNIFRVAMVMKRYKPEFIICKAQYDALLGVAYNHLVENETYANF